MAQFVLGKLTSSEQIGRSQNWRESLLVECCVPHLEAVYMYHGKQTDTSRIAVLSGWKLWLHFVSKVYAGHKTRFSYSVSQHH
jgi:hypothetical protein